MAKVWVPALLRTLTGEQSSVEAAGDTVGEVIEALSARYPGLRGRLVLGDRLHPTLAVAVDGEISLLGLRQPVRPESEIHILPALRGG